MRKMYYYFKFQSKYILNTADTPTVSFNSPGCQTLYFLRGFTHPGDGWVLAIVDTQEGSKLQQQLCAHGGIAMDPCYKTDLGLRRFSFLWFVGDFQSPNGSNLYTLAQTGRKREETRT